MENKMKMPLWGPYSKKYMGISHIIPALSGEGARFDFIVHPTIWNSSVPVPNVTVPSSYHLMECAPDYSYCRYRYELMWKDMVYADISFSKINENASLMRCEFVNNTELSQNCLMNLFGALEYPFFSKTEICADKNAIILNANDYECYEYAVPRPWDMENPDGMYKGMFRDSSFYMDCGLGDRCDNSHVPFLNLKPFGCEKGDRVSYKLISSGIADPEFAVRYRTVTEGDALFLMNGREVTFPSSTELSITHLPYCDNPEFISCGKGGIELDFIAVIEKGSKINVKTVQRDYIPEITSREKQEGGFVFGLDYKNGCKYTIETFNKNTRLRKLESGCLEDALVNRLSNGDPTYDDLSETFSRSFERKHSDTGFYVNPIIKSIFIEPGQSHIEYALVASEAYAPLSQDECEKIYSAAKEKAAGIPLNKDGKKYEFSVNVLKSTLLTNAVYPVYRRGENIVHHAPGKRWDSFYTWDSGFIGLGLLEYSKELCKYALETYLCEEDNKDFCFLLHGSLVPTQFYEYLELFNRCADKHSLDGLYDKMRRYYEFLRGRAYGSTFAKFGNGLLTAYDYWYSCSGMDDYPAQVEMIRRGAQEYSCPCLTTAQVIRCGKIMKMAADYLGKAEDIKIYDEDIRQSEEALNRLAWDEESGYFGYTVYDKDGKCGIMRTAEGENYNKGFDGVYPLVAGAVSGERKQKLISHLKNPDELWTPAGLSAVDISASYYFDDGYWNGNVWMSHQWFMWKTMLDNGEGDFAFEIANRALDMWKAETDFSYNTYECFGIKTRRGGWFHNFGGLSAPICIWANAYYRPGTVTGGLDLRIDEQKNSGDCADVKFRYFGNSEKYTVIIALNEAAGFSVTLDSKPADYRKRTGGAVEITIPGSVKEGRIVAKAL
ncbi:MAG: hypothetical protein IKY00_04250 [Clostridia bacterium]|nr:hypothetical protein [Clostridia bacterium]